MSTSTATTSPGPFPPRGAPDLSSLATRWRALRQLYPLYLELAQRFELGAASPELESPVHRSEPEVLARAENWFSDLDGRTDACHLRRVLQTSLLANEERLRLLLKRHLEKEEKSGSGRDKLDFLLVQYFDQCAPHSFQNGRLELEDVARVLEPVLGEASTVQPAWLDPLDAALADLARCRTLCDLLDQGVIERVRHLKDSAGAMYFGTATLLAFTRSNFLTRRAFFRLLCQDLQAIRQGLHELELCGVETLDCARAQLSTSEPLDSLRKICLQWKQPFYAPYSAGQSFRQLVEIRATVADALARSAAEKRTGSPALLAQSFSETSL